MKKKSKSLIEKLFAIKQKMSVLLLSLFQKLIQSTSSKKMRRIFEIFQLTIIYCLGISQLLLASLQASGYVPEIYKSVPFLKELLFSKFGSFLSNPEKTYVFYLLTHELIILRSHIFKFSIIVRYNILYVLTLEFLFYCIMNWVDIFCNFEKDLIFKGQTSSGFVTEFYFTLFMIYFCIYLYSYLRAINGKLPVFSNSTLQKIPDSIAFLLQIKKEESKKK